MHLLEVVEEFHIGMANEYELEGRNLEVDPRAIVATSGVTFEVICIHHDKGTTVRIATTGRYRTMHSTIYFRVYNPAKEDVPSFVSTTYIYHGLENERAPRDVIKVIIHPLVKVIRKEAFLYCKKLTSFEIHDDVEIIEDAAFTCCKALTSISLPRNLKKIGREAFSHCESMEECLMHDNVEEIGDKVFFRCIALKTIRLPKEIKKIGNLAFLYCEALEECHIYDNVEKIGNEAFSGCSALKLISLPQNLKKIGREAFSHCTKLKICQMYDNVKEIGRNAFDGCSALKTIRLPKTLKRIGDSAFARCRSLDAVFFPPGIEECGHQIFRDCGIITIVSRPSFIDNRLNTAFLDNRLDTAFRGTDISFMSVQNDLNHNLLPPLCKVCLDINVTAQTIHECIQANGPVSAILANTPGGLTPLHIMVMNPYANAGAILTCFHLNMSMAFERDESERSPLDYLWRNSNVGCFVSMIQALCLHREAESKMSSLLDITHPSKKQRVECKNT